MLNNYLFVEAERHARSQSISAGLISKLAFGHSFTSRSRRLCSLFFIIEFDESDFIESNEAELFPDGLERAFVNANEENAHIFETRP